MSLLKAIRFLEQGNWEDAHLIAQEDESALGSWAHGIVHLQEGDRENARYWYQRARRPFRKDLDIAAEIAALAAQASAASQK